MFLSTSISPENREPRPNGEIFQRYLKNCLSGIMTLGQNRQVIRKPELSKLIYSGERAQFHTITKAVMNHASHALHKYMGMRLYDLGDGKGYLLVNASSELSQYRKQYNDEQCTELTVIFLTLMEIFTSSNEFASEDQIREMLKSLNLEEAAFKKHFDMLQKKLYIVPVKNTAYQQEEKLYKWGPRAIAEVDPDKFMDSFLDLAGEGEAKDWPEQKRRIDVLKAVENR